VPTTDLHGRFPASQASWVSRLSGLPEHWELRAPQMGRFRSHWVLFGSQNGPQEQAKYGAFSESLHMLSDMVFTVRIGPRGVDTEPQNGSQSMNFKRQASWTPFPHETWSLGALAAPTWSSSWCPRRLPGWPVGRNWIPGHPTWSLGGLAERLGPVSGAIFWSKLVFMRTIVRQFAGPDMCSCAQL